MTTRTHSLRLIVAILATMAAAPAQSAGNGLFESGLIVPWTGQLDDIVAVDLDGDGLDDVIATSPLSGTVVIFRQTAPATFSTTSHPTISIPSALLVEDVDADGHLDVVVGGTGAVEVLVGDGTGSLQSPVLLSTTFLHNDFLVSADLQADGRPEILVMGEGGIISIANDATGFGLSTVVANGHHLGLAAGDINNDGNIDVARITSTTPGRFQLHLGDGTGALLPPSMFLGNPFDLPSNPLTNIAIADINGDSFDDIILTGALVHVLLGGVGSPSSGMTLTADRPFAGAPLLIDLDGDSDLDLLSRSAGGSLGVVNSLIGDGAGGFTTGFAIASSLDLEAVRSPRRLTVGHFNGDGVLDVVVADEGLEILFGGGQGRFGPLLATPHDLVFGNNAAAGDFDGDGHEDVAIQDFATTAVLFGDGTGGFDQEVLAATVLRNQVLAADFNGDGFDDLLLPCGIHDHPGHLIYYGDQNRNFTLAVTGANEDFEHVALADFNNDGMLDMFGSVQYFEVRVYEGLGGGNFGPGQGNLVPTTSGDKFVTSDDINRDGNADLIVVRDDFIDVAWGRGDLTFEPAVSFSTAIANPFRPSLGDFDGDGLIDLTCSSSVGLFVSRGTEGGGFGIPEITSPLVFGEIAVADFDHDGRDEIAVTGSQGTRIVEYDATGTLAIADSIQVGRAYPLAVDLIKGDGVPELAVGDSHELYTFRLPSQVAGTLEDFSLLTSVDMGAFDEQAVKSAFAAEPFSVQMSSPGGTFVGANSAMVMQLLLTGQTPTPEAAVGFPEIRIDPFAPLAPFELIAGPLPAPGVTVTGLVPPFADGVSAFFQSYAISTAAANSFFAATAMTEVRFKAPRPPGILSLTPLRAIAGTTITVRGQGFDLGAVLTVDGLPVGMTNLTSTGFEFVVPATVCDADVVVTNPDGQDVSAKLNPSHRITQVSPDPLSVTGGEFVRVEGSGLDSVTSAMVGSTTVTITSQTPCGTFLFFNSPPGTAGTVMLTLTSFTGCSVTFPLTYN